MEFLAPQSCASLIGPMVRHDVSSIFVSRLVTRISTLLGAYTCLDCKYTAGRQCFGIATRFGLANLSAQQRGFNRLGSLAWGPYDFSFFFFLFSFFFFFFFFILENPHETGEGIMPCQGSSLVLFLSACMNTRCCTAPTDATRSGSVLFGRYGSCPHPPDNI